MNTLRIAASCRSKFLFRYSRRAPHSCAVCRGVVASFATTTTSPFEDESHSSPVVQRKRKWLRLSTNTTENDPAAVGQTNEIRSTPASTTVQQGNQQAQHNIHKEIGSSDDDCNNKAKPLVATVTDDTKTGSETESSHQTRRRWEAVTKELLARKPKSWTAGRIRQVEHCLYYWRTNRFPGNPKTILRIWTRLLQEVTTESQITPAMYSCAIMALARHGFPRQAQAVLEDFFHKDFSKTRFHVPTEDWWSHNNIHVNAVIHAYAQTKQPELAEELLKTSFDSHNLIRDGDLHGVTSALDAWSRVGNGPRAQALLEWVQQEQPDISLDVAAYGTVLTAWARTENRPDAAQQAQTLLDRMVEMGLQPHAPCYSSVIVAWGNSEQQPEGAKHAQSVLSQAYSQNQANAVCFGNALYAWAKQGDAERALQLMHAWIADAQDMPQDAWPNVQSFNIVLHAIAKSRGRDSNAGAQAEALLPFMKRLGVKPDGFTYNSILDAWAQNGHAKEALSLLNKVEEGGFHGWVDTHQRRIAYNMTILAFGMSGEKCKNHHDRQQVAIQARKIFDRMQQNGIRPNEFSYNYLLKALAAASPETADSFFNYMEGPDCRIKPDKFCYNTVIDSWSKSGLPTGPVRAYELLKRMKDDPQTSVAPNVLTCNLVINAFYKSSHPDAAEHAEAILNEMEAPDTALPPPDLATYLTTLTVLSYSRDVNKANRSWDILQRMMARVEEAQKSNYRHNPQNIIRNAQNAVLAACAGIMAEHEKRREAFQIAQLTMEQCHGPNHVTYVRYFKAMRYLEEDPDVRHDLIRHAFLQHCREEKHPHSSVLDRLEKVTPKDVHDDIMREAGLL